MVARWAAHRVREQPQLPPAAIREQRAVLDEAGWELPHLAHERNRRRARARLGAGRRAVERPRWMWAHPACAARGDKGDAATTGTRRRELLARDRRTGRR